MDQARRLWMSRGVLAVAGLVCAATASRAAVVEEGGPLPRPAPGACPFCAPGKPCQEHLS